MCVCVLLGVLIGLVSSLYNGRAGLGCLFKCRDREKDWGKADPLKPLMLLGQRGEQLVYDTHS